MFKKYHPCLLQLCFSICSILISSTGFSQEVSDSLQITHNHRLSQIAASSIATLYASAPVLVKAVPAAKNLSAAVLKNSATQRLYSIEEVDKNIHVLELNLNAKRAQIKRLKGNTRLTPQERLRAEQILEYELKGIERDYQAFTKLKASAHLSTRDLRILQRDAQQLVVDSKLALVRSLKQPQMIASILTATIFGAITFYEIYQLHRENITSVSDEREKQVIENLEIDTRASVRLLEKSDIQKSIEKTSQTGR